MIHIFSDASCSEVLGVGCYCIMASLTDEINIMTVETDNYKSTKMEFFTILTALKSINSSSDQIIIYTDCKSFIRYMNEGISNAIDDVMKNELDQLLSQFDIEVVKIKGHNKKDLIITKEQEIFSIIDKTARKRLRHSNSDESVSVAVLYHYH